MGVARPDQIHIVATATGLNFVQAVRPLDQHSGSITHFDIGMLHLGARWILCRSGQHHDTPRRQQQ